MRKYSYIVALIGAFLMNGCSVVLENQDNCPVDRNLVLHFSNTDDHGNEIFSSVISKVEVFLFDQNNRLAYRQLADPAELVASKSISMKVDPGTYRVICWANVQESLVISINPGELLENAYVYRQATTDDTMVNGMPLYYAPYNRLTPQTFTVKPTERRDVDVRFRAAHVKMDFRVVNYATVTGATTLPYIEITTLYPSYDFLMSYRDIAAWNYMQQTVPNPTPTRAADLSYALIRTPRFENDNPIVINLRKDPQSPPLVSLVLKDVLAQAGIDMATRIENAIPFEIVFTATDVKITLTNWRDNPIDPDIN